MYRPPFEIISRLPWDVARDQGKEEKKWILVNVQDQSVFDCQVLNRDIWKDPQIKATIKENFIFMQYQKGDPEGNQYVQYYFHSRESPDAYPHIAIVDPRTGEVMKVWSGRPVPKASDFLMELHDFLGRYSLSHSAKNPVARRKPEKSPVDVGMMTEDQMMEMALQNSLSGNGAPGPRDDDPDMLTRSAEDIGKGKGKVHEQNRSEVDMNDSESNGHPSAPQELAASPFSLISSNHPHVEPPADPASTTRIQFRHPSGRVIRRFLLSDPVRRIYEWLKADPLEGKSEVEFDLVCMGQNLMEKVDETIEQAGLRNGTVMVEFTE
jgi:hypothetical protein